MSLPFHFVAPVHFEQWDYRNPDDPGIGGSETQVVEMARRLAARGEEVHVFAPIREDTEALHEGVHWHGLDDVDDARHTPAVSVLSRCPKIADGGLLGSVWVVCQDEDYTFFDKDVWNAERAAKIDRVIALCPEHAHALRQHEHIAEKVCLSTNGVRVDLLEQIESAETIERDPHKAVWCSSPDRGLVQAVLPNWARVRDFAKDLELHIYYGFDNIKKWSRDGHGSSVEHSRELLARFEQYRDQQGVVWHGRCGQPALYRELLGASIMPYWSDFKETGAIAISEAMCAGVFPITRPLWAVGNHVRYGAFYDGSAWDEGLALATAVAWTAHVGTDLEWQAKLRPRMMTQNRFYFDWERVVDQYQCWARGVDINGLSPDDHCLPLPWLAFQRLESVGETLVVGAGGDVANFREDPHAYRVDVCDVDPVTTIPNEIDEIMDGRDLLFGDKTFDTVVIGEVLEHASFDDIDRMLAEARRVARRRIVLTFPEETRPVAEQMDDARPLGARVDVHTYPGGLSTHHVTLLTPDDIRDRLGDPVLVRKFRTLAGWGWGMVFEP